MTARTWDIAPLPALRVRHPLVGQIARFVVAGGIGTLVNALLFLTLRTWWDLLPANLAALAVATLVSTEVNRRFTFSGEQGNRWRAHAQTAVMIVFYAVYTSTILLAVHAVVANPTPLLESVTVSVASVLGGAGRFLLLRFWVFGDDATDPPPRTRFAPGWHGVSMAHTTARRTIAAAVVGTALLLTSAGACGPTENGGVPGVTDQQRDGDDDGDRDDGNRDDGDDSDGEGGDD